MSTRTIPSTPRVFLFLWRSVCLLHIARLHVTQFRRASWFVLGLSVILSYLTGLCEPWMDILSGFESLPDAVCRLCFDFLGRGVNSAIFKDYSCGCKCSVNPSCLGSCRFLRALPTSHHRFLVECFSWRFWAYFCCLWISPGGAGYPGFLLWGAGHMVKRSCFACRHNGSQAASSQSKVICLRLCFEGDPQWVLHSGLYSNGLYQKNLEQWCASTHSKKSKFLHIYSAYLSRHFQVRQSSISAQFSNKWSLFYEQKEELQS